jgi:hypothetical protein
LALASARLAADAFLAGQGASAYQARFAAFATPQVRRAQVLSRMVTRPATAAAAVAAAEHAGSLLTSLARGLHPGRRVTS